LGTEAYAAVLQSIDLISNEEYRFLGIDDAIFDLLVALPHFFVQFDERSYVSFFIKPAYR